MKPVILGALALFAFVFAASAQVYVSPYVKRDGTYVQSHRRSSADGNFYNNWSTKGNYNPYTGSAGTRITPPSYGGTSTYRYSTPSYGRSFGSGTTYRSPRSRW